ncbi:MAG: lysozyme inhibitor LprI family protein [Pseudolabrys sp.]
MPAVPRLSRIDKQKVKRRDMQRAWIASRDKTCAFYWGFFQDTTTSPMTADCVNRETARRALFPLGFLNDAEGR